MRSVDVVVPLIDPGIGQVASSAGRDQDFEIQMGFIVEQYDIRRVGCKRQTGAIGAYDSAS